MQTDHEVTRARFLELLEAYGADIGRWPAGLQEAARARAAAVPDIALQLEREQAFDRLLARAPALEASPRGIDRILAAARSQAPRQGKAMSQDQVDATVIVLPSVARRLPGQAATARRSGRLGRPGHLGWRPANRQVVGAAGLLAASLLLGLGLGVSDIATPALGTAFATRPAASTDLEAMSEIVQSALSLELLEGQDEDFL